MNVEPLSNAEVFALKWVTLCQRFKMDPFETSALDFRPGDEPVKNFSRNV